MSRDATGDGGAHGRLAPAALLALLALAFAGFTTLGCWQVQRLHWKHALVARVESRIHAVPAPMPGRAAWPRIAAESDLRPLIAEAVIGAGGALFRLSVVEPSLDDIYTRYFKSQAANANRAA